MRMKKKSKEGSAGGSKEDSSEFEASQSKGEGISHQNSECVRQEKIERLRKKKKRIYSTKSKGGWDIEEDIRFMNFMIQNRQSFENRDLRRSNKVFKKMAKYVQTRCPEQCRSHHQKHEKKYHTFDGIVNSIKSKQPQHSSVKIQQERQENLNYFGSRNGYKTEHRTLKKVEPMMYQQEFCYKKQEIQKYDTDKQLEKDTTRDPKDYTGWRQTNQYEIFICNQERKYEILINLNIDVLQVY